MLTQQETIQTLLQDYPQLPASNPVRFSEYQDNYLKYLVLDQKFDFRKVTKTLRDLFPKDCGLVTQENVQRRWTQFNRHRREGVDQSQLFLNERKAKAAMAFQDPKKLMTANELIRELQQKQRQLKESGEQRPSLPPQQPPSFNMLTQSIRLFTPQQLREAQLKMRQQLQRCMEEEPVEDQYPMLFKPVFNGLFDFKVEGEKMTEQALNKIMAHRVNLPANWTASGLRQEQLEESGSEEESRPAPAPKRPIQTAAQPRGLGAFRHFCQPEDEDEQGQQKEAVKDQRGSEDDQGQQKVAIKESSGSEEETHLSLAPTPTPTPTPAPKRLTQTVAQPRGLGAFRHFCQSQDEDDQQTQPVIEVQ